MATLALLGSIVVPALASTKSRSQSAQCLNNLRVMGRGVQVWMSDHDGQPPWRTSVLNGGTLPDSGTKPSVAWFEYAYFSNEFVTPRILACPADDGVRIAPDFPSYLTTLYRANATSYALNLHSQSEFPTEFLFGDRNIRFNGGTSSCFARLLTRAAISQSSPTASWTNAVHGLYGNVVTLEGRSSETTTTELLLSVRARTENGSTHFLNDR